MDAIIRESNQYALIWRLKRCTLSTTTYFQLVHMISKPRYKKRPLFRYSSTVGNIVIMNMALLHYLKCSVWCFKNCMICCKDFLVHCFTTICLIIYSDDWHGLIFVFLFVSMMTNYNATGDGSWLKATWSNHNKISFCKNESTKRNVDIMALIRFCPANLTNFWKRILECIPWFRKRPWS